MASEQCLDRLARLVYMEPQVCDFGYVPLLSLRKGWGPFYMYFREKGEVLWVCMPCVIKCITCRLGSVWAKVTFVLSLSPCFLAISHCNLWGLRFAQNSKRSQGY